MIELIQWNTIISDCKSLFFKRLVNRSRGVFEVEDESGSLFEVILDNVGPYLVSDEEHLTKYWFIRTENIGSTFIVENSNFTKLFPGHTMELEKYTHYVVSTDSLCLEVLAVDPPVIRKVNR